MVGLKVSEGNQATMTPSPKKKDKKQKKLKGVDSPAEAGNKAVTPSKPLNGAESKQKPSTPTPSPNGQAVSKKKKKNKNKGKDFGKFGNRNQMKEKDDVFTKMVKENAVKEHISPAFLKKLDKCIARLPPAGKRFVYWLVHDVKYKIKFLPVIEDVFKLIKDSDVMPLPASGKRPMTNSEKKKAKREKRNALRGDAKPAVKKEQTEKRKIDEVSATEDATVAPDSQKKKKIKKEKLESSSLEPADSSFNANEGSVSAKKKKVKKEKISSPGPVDASFSAEESILSGSGKKKKKNKKSLG